MSRDCYGIFLAVENRRCRGKPPFFVSVTIRAVMIRGSLFQVSFALVGDILSIFRGGQKTIRTKNVPSLAAVVIKPRADGASAREDFARDRRVGIWKGRAGKTAGFGFFCFGGSTYRRANILQADDDLFLPIVSAPCGGVWKKAVTVPCPLRVRATKYILYRGK